MSKLAINGGKKILPENHVEWPMITSEEKKTVKEVLDSKILWGAFGPQVKALEKEWAEYIGSKYCIATNSGTAALHIAVKGAGVLAGDEVITSSLTFVASALAILHANAIPIFVDINPNTYNIDPLKIESKISEKTKAIMPVHLHGMPADMDEINNIARKYNLIVIEDSAQAHGALYKSKKAGSLGDMAEFSLNGSKVLPGCEGGLFNTNDDLFWEKAKRIRDLGEFFIEGEERGYNASEIGWMYRYTEMPAAIVRKKIKTLDEENKIRTRNAKYLSSKLNEFKGIIPPYIPDDRTSTFHLYRIRLQPKDLGFDISSKEFRVKVQKALRAEGIQVNRWQNRPVPMQDLFQKRIGYGYGCPWTCPYGKGSSITYEEDDFTETQKVVDDSFIIYDAIYPPNGIELMNKYIDAFNKLWDNIDEVLAIEIDPGEFLISN